ncbi:MAG: DUF3014 domain-containing protein [Proteobacteria bacterium]|nr:DUF3014 domain-containing protein [Pseudomonadota bacterium]
MERRQLLAIGIVVLAAAGAGYYLWHGSGSPPPPPATAVPASGPQIEHPLTPASGAPLPPLADSDAAFAAAIATLAHAPTLPDLFFPDKIARRWVATIDNLPREQVAAEVRALRPPGGALATRGAEDSLTIAPDNATRYARYMALLAAIDPQEAAGVYRRYYPLLQQAYEELGYPGQYFNDRVVAVIDHLLATPDVADPIRLVHPSVMYRYADARLESLSAGQKALVRIGRDNAAVVRAKLKALRAEIVVKP